MVQHMDRWKRLIRSSHNGIMLTSVSGQGPTSEDIGESLRIKENWHCRYKSRTRVY